MKKSNCYVVVNCGDRSVSAGPDFGGVYETTEDVYEHYNRYETFTQRVFSSLRAAKKEAERMDENVCIGDPCFVVCGCYCKQYERR